MKETMHILLYRAFHAQRNILRPFMRELGLGAGQPKIIVYLEEHGPCRQRELADYGLEVILLLRGCPCRSPPKEVTDELDKRKG